jgi:hypothetical protein
VAGELFTLTKCLVYYDCSAFDINCNNCTQDKCLRCKSSFVLDQYKKCQKIQYDTTREITMEVDIMQLPEELRNKTTDEIISDIINDIEREGMKYQKIFEFH